MVRTLSWRAMDGCPFAVLLPRRAGHALAIQAAPEEAAGTDPSEPGVTFTAGTRPSQTCGSAARAIFVCSVPSGRLPTSSSGKMRRACRCLSWRRGSGRREAMKHCSRVNRTSGLLASAFVLPAGTASHRFSARRYSAWGSCTNSVVGKSGPCPQSRYSPDPHRTSGTPQIANGMSAKSPVFSC